MNEFIKWDKEALNEALEKESPKMDKKFKSFLEKLKNSYEQDIYNLENEFSNLKRLIDKDCEIKKNMKIWVSFEHELAAYHQLIEAKKWMVRTIDKELAESSK